MILAEIEKLEIYFYEHILVAPTQESSLGAKAESLHPNTNELEYSEENRRQSFYFKKKPEHEKEDSSFHRYEFLFESHSY